MTVVGRTDRHDSSRCPSPRASQACAVKSSARPECPIMDLVTLVAACALTVDPKLMHALVWHQSGGEPWWFSVLREQQPQIYRSAREAAYEALAAPRTGLPIRFGLTGLVTDTGSA